MSHGSEGIKEKVHRTRCALLVLSMPRSWSIRVTSWSPCQVLKFSIMNCLRLGGTSGSVALSFVPWVSLCQRDNVMRKSTHRLHTIEESAHQKMNWPSLGLALKKFHSAIVLCASPSSSRFVKLIQATTTIIVTRRTSSDVREEQAEEVTNLMSISQKLEGRLAPTRSAASWMDCTRPW